jgi:hypothetical protein
LIINGTVQRKSVVDIIRRGVDVFSDPILLSVNMIKDPSVGGPIIKLPNH